jgi:hypothetical protein
MISSALKIFVVEYSVLENSTHTRTLERVLRDNVSNVSRGLSKDYLPVGLFESRDEADRFVERFNLVIAPEAQLESVIVVIGVASASVSNKH